MLRLATILILVTEILVVAKGYYYNNEPRHYYPYPATVSTLNLSLGSYAPATFLLEGRNDSETIVIDRHNVAIANFASDPPKLVKLLAGGYGPGYREGVGGEAMFRYPSGAAYLNDTHILVTDTQNNCIRSVSLVTRQTARYAGRTCEYSLKDTFPGTSGNRLLVASFNNPTGIIKHQGKFFVADARSDSIRIIENDTVSDLITPDFRKIKSPFYMTVVGENLFVTQRAGMLKVNIFTKTYTLLTGRVNAPRRGDGTLAASRYDSPKGILAINESIFVMADTLNNRLRVIDVGNDQVYSICNGGSGREMPDGEPEVCQIAHPWALLSRGPDIIITTAKNVRKLSFTEIVTTTTEKPTTTELQNEEIVTTSQTFPSTSNQASAVFNTGCHAISISILLSVFSSVIS